MPTHLPGSLEAPVLWLPSLRHLSSTDPRHSQSPHTKTHFSAAAVQGSTRRQPESEDNNVPSLFLTESRIKLVSKAVKSGGKERWSEEDTDQRRHLPCPSQNGACVPEAAPLCCRATASLNTPPWAATSPD